MLRIFPNRYITHLCQRVNEETSLEDMQRLSLYLCGNDHRKSLLPVLNEQTCVHAQGALQRCNPAPLLFRTHLILKLANMLPSDHPGWPLLSLMVEHTGMDETLQQGNIETVAEGRIPFMEDNLGTLMNRLINKEFAVMQPYAVVVWIACRLKVRSSDAFESPLGWEDILRQGIESPALVSTSTSRFLLKENLNMILSRTV